jgi:hypothetical protein
VRALGEFKRKNVGEENIFVTLMEGMRRAEKLSCATEANFPF